MSDVLQSYARAQVCDHRERWGGVARWRDRERTEEGYDSGPW